jgi:hypothetical protein
MSAVAIVVALSFLMPHVLPGEHVPAQHVNLKLGPGLLQLNTQPVISTRAGQLHHSQNNSRWWVEGNARRVSVIISHAHLFIFIQYVPAPQESVIGVVLGRSADGWRVDVGSAHPALLDGLAFEGATKRSKPNLKVRSSPVAHSLTQSLSRSVPWFTRACPSHIKTWSPNWNVSMLRHTKPKVLASSVVDLLSSVAYG